MRNSAQGVWNPAKNLNPESIPLTRDPGSVAWNPESNTVMGRRFCSQKTEEWSKLRACLNGGGGLQIGEVIRSRSLHLSCKRDQIKMRDYMDRQLTPPKLVTLPTVPGVPHLHVNRPLIKHSARS